MNGDEDDLPLFTRYRSTDPDTSREAIEGIADKLTDIQSEVLAALERAGRCGLADCELAVLFPNAGQSTYRTRRSELVAKGLVVNSGRKIKRRGGTGRSHHIVWILARFADRDPQ